MGETSPLERWQGLDSIQPRDTEGERELGGKEDVQDSDLVNWMDGGAEI